MVFVFYVDGHLSLMGRVVSFYIGLSLQAFCHLFVRSGLSFYSYFLRFYAYSSSRIYRVFVRSRFRRFRHRPKECLFLDV